MRSRRWLPLLLSCAALGCAEKADWSAGDPGDPPKRAEQARAELERFGDHLFLVDTFQATSEAKLTFSDFYEYPTHLFAVNFTASVRCARSFQVPQRDSLIARQESADFSVPDFERDSQLLSLVGEGTFASGQKVELQGAAAFDAYEPGFRFRLFDRVRTPTP